LVRPSEPRPLEMLRIKPPLLRSGRKASVTAAVPKTFVAKMASNPCLMMAALRVPVSPRMYIVLWI
jgi:hypothetical protein